jgi:hypothetical protein
VEEPIEELVVRDSLNWSIRVAGQRSQGIPGPVPLRNGSVLTAREACIARVHFESRFPWTEPDHHVLGCSSGPQHAKAHVKRFHPRTARHNFVRCGRAGKPRRH